MSAHFDPVAKLFQVPYAFFDLLLGRRGAGGRDKANRVSPAETRRFENRLGHVEKAK
jgi:hypothetical protein